MWDTVPFHRGIGSTAARPGNRALRLCGAVDRSVCPLGGSRAVGETSLGGDTSALPLRAYRIRLGDLTFSHYYPACRNILGFHDDLAGVHEDASLSYLVAGWYSDPACDLLTAAQKGGKSSDTSIADRMANLSWHYPQIDRETPPTGFSSMAV